MFDKNLNKIFLVVIFIIAFVVRFYLLDQIPSGFHADEAAFGYNAYSILKTGKDEYGEILPLILRSFDDYKGAVYAYLTVPSVAIFGLTEFAVRLPTAIFGSLFVVLSYLLSLKLTNNKYISLLTSFLVAINPLSIFLSRVQSDPLVSIFFILLGFYCFLLWIEKNKIYLILLSAILWIASIYTYPSPRVLLPVLFLSILIFYFKKLTSSQKKVLILILLIITIIDFSVTTGASYKSRLKQLSVFNAPIVILPMEEKIREDQAGSVFATRAFHNKIVDHFLVVSKNYFDYFNYDFLFLKGGQPEREKLPNMGILYIVELPFLLYGIYLALKNKEKWEKLTLFLVFVFPLAISFAVDESPNVHRYYINIFFLELLIALGFMNFLSNLKNKHSFYFRPILLVLILIFVYNFSYFMHQLFVHQPVHQSWYRGYAYKELIQELNKREEGYKKIIFTKTHSSPYVYLLFFKRYDPVRYQAIGSPRDFDNTGFDKYLFVSKECPFSFYVDKNRIVISDRLVKGEKDILYINRGDCPNPPNSKLLKTIYWKDNNPAFKLIEFTGR